MGIRENQIQGDDWEVRFEIELERQLPYNYDRQRLFGGTKPDYLTHDDAGQHEAFIEVKSGEEAGTHDMAQACEHVRQAAVATTLRTTYFVTKPGFFSDAQKEQILEAGSSSDRVVFFEVQNPEDGVPEVIADLRTRQAEHAAREAAAQAAQAAEQTAAYDVDGLPDAPEPPPAASTKARPAPVADVAAYDVDGLPQESPRTTAPANPATPAAPTVAQGPQHSPAAPASPATPNAPSPAPSPSPPPSPFLNPGGRR